MKVLLLRSRFIIMIEKTKHQLFNGDSRNLSQIPDKSVHLIITSPPYWQLKDYGSDNQIGFHDSYEEYINNLNVVWAECDRILHEGCRLCINIGDQFARSVYYGRYKVIPIRTEIIRFCETLGMDYMGAIIWQKQTTMNTTGGAAIMGSFPYPRNGILKIDYEFILIFKKQGKAPTPTAEQKSASEMSREEWNTFFSSHWNFGGAKQDGHIAVFPEELPHRLIKMFSFVGETVFDPFMGSGTTALAARNLGRNSIGYEINPDFRTYYEQKVTQPTFFDNAEFEYFIDENPFDIEKKRGALPYQFQDPHKMDNKIDVKSMQFGSKIDGEKKERQDLFTVKSVCAPNIVKLSNDLVVKLIGVKPKEGREQEAVDFLFEKTKGKKVFVKFDSVKFDEHDNLLCYLYLENKTFINSHLVKSKLVDVDNSMIFKYIDKFNKLYNE